MPHALPDKLDPGHRVEQARKGLGGSRSPLAASQRTSEVASEPFLRDGLAVHHPARETVTSGSTGHPAQRP